MSLWPKSYAGLCCIVSLANREYGLKSNSDNRRARTSRMRSIMSVVVIAWLNLALQPCAMALGGMEEHDCPRCPPSHEDARADHAMHNGHAAEKEAKAGDMPCSTAATDCTLLDELNYDGRTVKLELNDAPNESPVAIAPPFAFEPKLKPIEYLGWHSTRSPPPPASVPLDVYYCVYLK